MAAKYLRRQTWWVRFYHPRTGALMRASLETPDSARAELLRQRVELEAALLEPRFQAADLPPCVRDLVRTPETEAASVSPPTDLAPQPLAIPVIVQPKTTIDSALKSYLDFIGVENSSHHVAAKLSMMRRFFGSQRVEALTGRAVTRGQKSANDHSALFQGEFVHEITALALQRFMDQLEVSKKTKRHYREFFHHFFEFCMKFDFYQPTNWH